MNRHVTIKCPECGHEQPSVVTHPYGDPRPPLYHHECARCEYVIIESEWQEVVTIKTIVANYLRQYGFDGLAGDECACNLNDLFCACEYANDCVAGYKWECEKCHAVDCPHRGDQSEMPGSGCMGDTRQ